MNSKESILDVKAVDDQKRIFDVEIQVIGNSKYVKRTLYYWAKNYCAQLRESENYSDLRPVICINILDFVIFDNLEKLHSCFLPIEKDKTENVLTEDFQIHFFELPKMQTGDILKINERLKKWAYFFNNEGLMEEDEEMNILLKNDPVMEKAHTVYKKFSADDELLQVYEAREKRIRDEVTRLADAKNEGLKLGVEQGVKQGVKQGLQMGKEAERREIALNMINENMDMDVIAKITGYSDEELQGL